jgi:hypothetical protein
MGGFGNILYKVGDIMDIEILKEKSEQNFITGEWAEKREFYDVSISRYYYCIFQKIIYIKEKRVL